MKKLKIIASLFAFLMVLCAASFSMQVSAADALSQSFAEGTYYFTVTDGEATITDADVKGEITVPDTLGGYPVTAVGDRAFDYLDDLEKVTVPGTVKILGDLSFSYCESLHTVIMHEGVEVIGKSAFFCYEEWDYDPDIDTGYPRSSSLRIVRVPDSVKIIGDYAFSDTLLSGAFTLPKSLEQLGYGVFDFTLIDTIVIPAEVKYSDKIIFSDLDNNIKSIVTEEDGDYFYNVDGLLLGNDKTVVAGFIDSGARTITIPDTVKEINEKVFYFCNNLVQVTLPDSLTKIGPYAFSYCLSLEKINLPDSITEIQKSAFSNCGKLYDVNIPSKVEKIGDYAFYSTRITGDIVFPETLESIGENAFGNCIFLTGISFAGDIDIGTSAFNSCDSLTKVEFKQSGNLTLASTPFAYCYNLKTLSLPQGKVVLGSKLFENTGIETFEINTSDLTAPEDLFSEYEKYNPWVAKGKVKTIVIGKNVNTLNINALECATVTSVVIDEENNSYVFDENAIYNKDKTELIRYYALLENYYDKMKSFAVPDTVKIIGPRAFSGGQVLEIKLNDSVEQIGSYAFYKSRIGGVFTVPQNVEAIGAYAFAFTDITSLVISGSKLSSLTSGMFRGCSSLTEVYYTGSKESFDSFAKITEGSYLSKARLHFNTNAENHPYAKKLVKQGNFEEGGVYLNTCSCGNSYNTYFNPIGEIEINHPNSLPSDYPFSVKVKDKPNHTLEDELVEGVDYTYTFAPSSKGDGMFDFKFTFMGRYTGECTETITVKFAKPAKITATVAGSSANLSWSAVKGATGYKLYRYDYTADNWKLIADTAKTTYTDKGLAASTGYRYAVKAYTTYEPLGIVVSDTYATVSAVRKANGLKATAVDSTSIKLSWNKVAGATGYRIFVKNETTNKWQVAVRTTGKATQYTLKGLTPGTKYIYAVRSYVNNGKIVWAPTYISASAATPPNTVTGLKATEHRNYSVTLTWNKVKATGYRVFVYNTSTKKWNTVVSSTTDNTVTVEKLKIGTTYTFAVRPYINTGKEIVWSKTYTKITTSTMLPSVYFKQRSSQNNTVSLSWYKVSEATGYQVWYSTKKSGGFKKLGNYGSTSATHTGLASGSTYYYRLRAYKAVGGTYVYSPWGSVVSVTVK